MDWNLSGENARIQFGTTNIVINTDEYGDYIFDKYKWKNYLLRTESNNLGSKMSTPLPLAWSYSVKNATSFEKGQHEILFQFGEKLYCLAVRSRRFPHIYLILYCYEEDNWCNQETLFPAVQENEALFSEIVQHTLDILLEHPSNRLKWVTGRPEITGEEWLRSLLGRYQQYWIQTK